MAASNRLFQELVMDYQNLPYGLLPESTPGAAIESVDWQTWRLSIPAGPGGRYRLAQLDNYGASRRSAFPQRPPFSLELEGRASASNLPGTWGFGVWNDPFSMGVLTGRALRFPVLPNTAWFFFASPENFLSLRNDLPASGALAATYRSPNWSSAFMLPAVLALPLMALPGGRKLVRRLTARVVNQAAVLLKIDPAEWHNYQIEWRDSDVRFSVDGKVLLDTQISPNGPLGLVIWIDNQYAAFRPDGGVAYGMLANDRGAWIEVRNIRLPNPRMNQLDKPLTYE